MFGRLFITYLNEIVDYSSVFTRFLGQTNLAVVTRHSAIQITFNLLRCWTFLSLMFLISSVISHFFSFLSLFFDICLQSCPTGPHEMSSQQVVSSSMWTQSSGSFLIPLFKFSIPRVPTWSILPCCGLKLQRRRRQRILR